jgi:hypothetical protein
MNDPGRATQDHVQSLYRAAVEHLVRGRADLATPIVTELSKLLPGNAHVQHIARQAAIMVFPWPAERGNIDVVKREAPEQSAIDLVTFHITLPANPSGIHAPIDYMALIALSVESAALRAPDARRILITDEATAVPADIPFHEVRRYPIDSQRVMFERMRVQELYLRDREAGRLSVLMDSDVVVNADPAAVFTETFDVGLTWRPQFPDAPFNGGMIFVSEGSAGREFFSRAIACYEAFAASAPVASMYPRDLKSWWGDQFALALMVGYREYAERRGDTLSVDGLRVRLFPCADYNFVFEGATGYSPEELRRKFFIHFKGNRKAMQVAYLERMRAGTL